VKTGGNREKAGRFLKIGYIRAAHGLKGGLLVRFQGSAPGKGENLFFEKDSDLQGPRELLSLKKHGTDWIVEVSGCSGIDEAEGLSGYSVGIKKDKLPEKTYWVEDIIGCSVYTRDGTLLGRVQEVISTGSNDVYVVKSADGREVLIPALKTVVWEVDIAGRKIYVDPMPGIL